MIGWHITRTWTGGDKAWFGYRCPCAEAPCGFVIADQECPEHAFTACKTMRGGHRAENCPGGDK